MEQDMRTQAPCKHPQIIGVTTASVMDALVSHSSCREGTSPWKHFPKDKQKSSSSTLLAAGIVPAGSHQSWLPTRLRRGCGSTQQQEGWVWGYLEGWSAQALALPLPQALFHSSKHSLPPWSLCPPV